MNRTEFIIATAVALFVAFVLGWLASWLVQRLSRASQAELSELEAMATALHDAEEARDDALRQLEAREAELRSKLQQTEAELRAAMDGLRDARAEVAALQAHLDS
ncbi:MAG: hypothetical protein D6688_03995, partial [Alphaproteobacteria bacterium]